jgi:hypothetical protein
VLAGDDDDREFVLVNNTADLLENIGRDNIELYLAPGDYVLQSCSGGLDESSPTCGQMQQGDNSVLRSDLELDLDYNGVPTGMANGGAIIDCSPLPPSDLKSCIVAGDGSTIRNLTIRNGPQTPEPDPPGGEADNRNGIIIVAGKEAVVDGVRLINTRRGVLFTTESGMETRGVVRHSLIDGTELAGIFLHAKNPDNSNSSNSKLRGAAEANRLTHIGLHPLLFLWTLPTGIGNDSHAVFTENIVDSSNIYGITIEGFGSLGAPAQDNTASFKIQGGRLEGGQGLTILTIGNSDNSNNNCVVGEVEDLTIENGEPAVEASLTPAWGTGNKFLLEMENSVYISDTSEGNVVVTDDAGNDFQIVGTPEEFMHNNTNFDISNVSLDDFTGDVDLCNRPAKMLKETASFELSLLLPTGDKKDDKYIQEAIDRIDQSLNPDWWLDASTLDPKNGKLVFDREHQAVQELMKVKTVDVQAIIDALVEVDRQIAHQQLIAAINGGGDPGRIATAQDNMADAAEHVAAGDFAKAVLDYKKAWTNAVKALE